MKWFAECSFLSSVDVYLNNSLLNCSFFICQVYCFRTFSYMTYTSTLHVDTVRLKKIVQLLSQIRKMML